MRFKPQVSAVFDSGSIGIDADRINPEPALHSAGLELMESGPKALRDIDSIGVNKYRYLLSS